MRDTDDDVRWVTQAQCGDRDAMEHVLRTIQIRLRRYVHRLVGPAASDDVLQTALISIAKHLTWLSEPRLFRPWAYRIASRAAFEHLRREKRLGRHYSEETLLNSLVAAEPRPSSLVVQELLDRSGVSPPCRAVLMLHFQEEMPLADVAAVLELPLGTVKSRLAYGLAALRRHLAKKKESPYG
jgi:RNA polymerase sigma-70 factor (ECF subfamily)